MTAIAYKASALFQRAVWLNRRRWKYRRLACRLRLLTFEYEDRGQLDRLRRVVARCRAIAAYHEV